MRKIGILVTHPIQYLSPFFKELAKESDLIVYYCLWLDKKKQGNEFDIEFEWDMPLLEGYKYEFLNNISKSLDVNSYSGCDTPEIEKKIKDGNFDLFIVFGWYYKSAHQALAACKKYKVPIYARGDSTLLSGNFIIRMAKQIYFKNFLAKFDGFLSVGKMFEEYLKFYGVPKEKIIFCPHFVDSNFFKANTAQSFSERINLRKSYNINKDEPILLFCGKLVERKRPFDFLKALKAIKNRNIKTKGLIIGDGILNKKLKKYAAKHKLNVLFLGFLNQTQLPKMYSIADCLILPSNGGETWGLVVNEAFACGVPAIVSDKVGCGPDLIEEGKTGYVYDCGNVKELAYKIEQFAEIKKKGFDFTPFIHKKMETYCIEKAIESIKEIFKNQDILDAKDFRILVILGATSLYGAEKSTLRLAKALKDYGASVHFITHKKWGYEVAEEIDRCDIPRSGAIFGPLAGRNIIYNPVDFFLVIKGIVFTSISVAKAIRDFRPTHIHIGNTLYFLYSFFAFIFCKIPVIYHLGSLIPEGLHGVFFKQVIAKKAACFTCISKYMKNYAMGRGITEEKLKVVYNYPPFDESKIEKQKFIYRKDPNKVIVTLLGQLHVYKGLHIFIQAAIEYAKERDDIIFYIAGDYTYKNPYALNEIRKVKKLGLENKIIFLGYLKKPHLLLQESDILCAPSIFEEPLGNVVLEAKVAGIPSVVFPSGGLPEMIEHKIDGYICRQRTKEALKEGISYFLDNRNFLEDAKGKAFASLKKFDKHELTIKQIKNLREVLK